MAVPKICGIETEYGIIVRGAPDWNPVSASSLLINAYVATGVGSLDDHTGPIAWDFIDEMPGADARDLFSPEFAMPPEIETHLVNTVLTNGARYYVDHAHPEISTPEVTSARDVVVFDRAAEEIVRDSMAAANKMLPGDAEVVIYKDNTDRKGNAYGTHENYLLERQTPFGRIIDVATTHFVTRQIFTGAGKVGCELPGFGGDVPFQLTQRADHFEEEVGLETTLKRPIVNTRDEPHADSKKYRRLHVIVGDANLSETATLLKVGTSQFVFAMLEDGVLDDLAVLDDPVPTMWAVSHDLTLSKPLALADGSTMTALEIQQDLCARAHAWAETRGFDLVGGERSGRLVLDEWQLVLDGLATDPMTLADRIDWVAKKRLFDAFRARHGCGWDDDRLRALDLQYHDLRVGRGLAAKVGLRRITTDDEVQAAKTTPPTDTRAYFRGRVLQKYTSAVVAANWDSIVFDTGDEPLRRVPMLEPSRGTEAHVGELLDASDTVADLLAKLGS